MTATLLNKDFNGNYLSNTRCALAKALKRQLDPTGEKETSVLVGERSVSIDGQKFKLSAEDNKVIRREYLYEAADRGPLTITLE